MSVILFYPFILQVQGLTNSPEKVKRHTQCTHTKLTIVLPSFSFSAFACCDYDNSEPAAHLVADWRNWFYVCGLPSVGPKVFLNVIIPTICCLLLLYVLFICLLPLTVPRLGCVHLSLSTVPLYTTPPLHTTQSQRDSSHVLLSYSSPSLFL